MRNKLLLTKTIFLEEGIINYIKRKLNLSYLDNKTTFTIKYRNRKTKILLNRKFGHVDLMIFKNGIYEKDIIDDIYHVLTPQKILLDIGANIGQHSLLLSPYCKEVYAFEPILDVYRQFKKSIEKNHYKNIHLFNIAIGDKKESKFFNFVKNHAGTSSFVERDHPKNAALITVHTDTLENVLKDIKFDVIKLDVEGYEAVVILGNKEIIKKNKPVIFMEFNPAWILKEGNYTPEDVFKFFIENDFEIFSRNYNKIINSDALDTNSQDNWIINPRK